MLKRLITLGLLLLVVSRPGYCAEEYLIKAGFVLNFLKFVVWQDVENNNASSDIQVCIVSRGAMPRSLMSIDNKQVNNRTIRVQAYISEQFNNCQVFYILASQPEALKEILPLAATRPILTIGEHDTFMAENGIINFMIEGKKMRFEINRTVAARVGISISAKLLQLAVKVH